MNITINLTAVAIGALIVIAVILAVYIVITLQKLNRTLNNINSMIDESRKDINLTIKSIPPILDNVNKITASVKSKTDVLDHYFNKEDEVASTIDFETITSGISSIINLVLQAKESFVSKKRVYKRK